MQNLSTFWKEYKQLDNNPLTKQTGSSKQNRTKPKNSIPVHPFRSRESKPWRRRCLWTMLVGQNCHCSNLLHQVALKFMSNTTWSSMSNTTWTSLDRHVPRGQNFFRFSRQNAQDCDLEIPAGKAWHQEQIQHTQKWWVRLGQGDSAIWSKLINKTIETRQPFWSLPCLCILDLLGSLLCRL